MWRAFGLRRKAPVVSPDLAFRSSRAHVGSAAGTSATALPNALIISVTPKSVIKPADGLAVDQLYC